MLSVEKMIASARECLGWPYVNPGSNDKNGIDCSGLFVKIFRDQGAKIAHGSNTIYHEYCTETGMITDVRKLIPGMAVFKLKEWTEKDKDNKWYGHEPGNLSHIGIVISAYPSLEIIHASSETEKVVTDTKIGKWACWGKLKNVEYGANASSPNEAVAVPQGPVWAKVWSENGSDVKLRFRPTTQCTLYDLVPVGRDVLVYQKGEEWCKVSYGNRVGWYMMTKFLQFEGEEEIVSGGEGADSASNAPATDMAIVISENGNPVKLRSKPTTKNGLYDELPAGTIVQVERRDGDWTKVTYGNRKGWYIMSQFLKSMEKDKEEN